MLFEVKVEAYNAKNEKKSFLYITEQPTFGGAEERAVKFTSDAGFTDITVKAIKLSKINLIVDESILLTPFVIHTEIEVNDTVIKEQILACYSSIDDAAKIETEGEIKKIVSSKIMEII